jgi:hypothetical protein
MNFYKIRRRENKMGTVQILLWVATGGGAALLFSWGTDRWDYYKTLPVTSKQLFYYAGVALLSCLAYAGVQYIPAEVVALIDPYVKIVVVALGLGVGGTFWHSVRKA